MRERVRERARERARGKKCNILGLQTTCTKQVKGNRSEIFRLILFTLLSLSLALSLILYLSLSVSFLFPFLSLVQYSQF